MSTTVTHDDTQAIHNDRKITVDGTHTEAVKLATKIEILEGTYSHDVKANTAKYHVKGALTERYEDTQTTTVTKEIVIDSGKHIYITAADEIKLTTGDSMIQMLKDGTIKIHGKNVEVIGTAEVKNGVHTQSITLNTSKVETSGAAITTSAVGVHEISGALIKIN
jgi:type VI secretion system secreted protein VgrG